MTSTTTTPRTAAEVMHDISEKLPKRVKVGSFTYRLERVPTGHEGLEGDNYGMTDLERSRIYFDASTPFERLVNTVLHEIGHAIDNSYGIDDGVDEEVVATQSANGWMQVYLDNPKLELWLHRAWRELRKSR